MAWLMQIGLGCGEPMFAYEDKSGFRANPETPLPFFRWIATPPVTDFSNIPAIAIQTLGTMLTDAFWVRDTAVISLRFKDLIEELELGVHDFFPVTLKRKNGTPYPERYFIFHPTRYAPCVLLSKCGIRSKGHSRVDGEPYFFVHWDKYVISRPAYGARKIFHSLFLNYDELLITDDVAARIKAEKLINVHLYAAQELDEPWVFEREAPELAEFLKTHPESSCRLQAL